MARTAGYISEVPDYRPQAVKGDAAVFQEQWAKAIGGFAALALIEDLGWFPEALK